MNKITYGDRVRCDSVEGYNDQDGKYSSLVVGKEGIVVDLSGDGSAQVKYDFGDRYWNKLKNLTKIPHKECDKKPCRFFVGDFVASRVGITGGCNKGETGVVIEDLSGEYYFMDRFLKVKFANGFVYDISEKYLIEADPEKEIKNQRVHTYRIWTELLGDSPVEFSGWKQTENDNEITYVTEKGAEWTFLKDQIKITHCQEKK